jgi:ribosomal protein S18 acetylase RimI-like enzyme
MSKGEWRDHFGSAFGQLDAAKQQYDPGEILTPGYEIHYRGRTILLTLGDIGDDVRVACHPEFAVAVKSPAAEESRQILRAYFTDVASRYLGHPATEDEIAAAMREDPSDDLTLPGGLLLVAQEKGSVLGCAGLRLLPGHAAEVTRVFVIPAARRRGLGSRLLDCLEGHARHHRVTTLRLDTRRDLIEARRLYARHGYREVTPFSSGPYADHWFEKTLP